jgi:hypothetical protein
MDEVLRDAAVRFVRVISNSLEDGSHVAGPVSGIGLIAVE